MRRRYFLFSSIVLIAVIIAGGVIAYLDYFNTYVKYGSVRKFGPLRLGHEILSGPGDLTFAPILSIPPARFYVTIIQSDHWCTFEDCGSDGALVRTMGGWLQMDDINVYVDAVEEVGFNLEENKNVKSIVLIGDQNGKIAGIYPDKNIEDIIPILKLHPNLANFDLLKGVPEFSALKVGEPAPLQPGDSLTHLGNELARYSITHVPTSKKFYLFSVQKRKYDRVGGNAPYGASEPYENKYICFLSGCRYPEPDAPHDSLFAHIEDLGGWFFSNDIDDAQMPALFGLSQTAVLTGASSLVVLADAKGTITALHPGKTLSDALTILSQHPELADVAGLYKPHK